MGSVWGFMAQGARAGLSCGLGGGVSGVMPDSRLALAYRAFRPIAMPPKINPILTSVGSMLPIDPHITSILSQLESHNIVLVATPGSGKTTRLPPAVARRFQKRVLCVEPRRIACIAAAQRIAQSEGMALGRDVGYHVRLEKRATSKTPLTFVTTGMLLRYLCEDPFLEAFGTVIFDEFHERSLEADLALAMVRHVQAAVRDDLRVAVMSATLEYGSVADYLGNCVPVVIDAPIFPLEVRYMPRSYGMRFGDYSAALMDSVASALRGYGGDCLVFLPGTGDIRMAIEMARSQFGDEFELLPCHASLGIEEQKYTLSGSGDGRRRVIFSTNVAESSVTVPNVRSVVDSGLEKVKFFDSAIGLSRLQTERISCASADQRAGRAARTAAGLCIRLWDERMQRQLGAHATAQIERLDLSQAWLQIAAWGVETPENLVLLSPPAKQRMEDARELLSRLGAVDARGSLTPMGREMASLPLEPRLARWMIEAKTHRCMHEASILAAYLSEAPYRRANGELWRTCDLWEDFQFLQKNIRRHEFSSLYRISQDILSAVSEAGTGAGGDSGEAERQKKNRDSREALVRSMMAAYPDRLAKPRPQTVKLAPTDPRRDITPVYACMSGNRGVVIERPYTLKDASYWLCIDLDLVKGVQRAANKVVKAMAVDSKWIPWQAAVVARYEADKDRVVVADAVYFDIFTLRETFLHGSEYDALYQKTLFDAAAADIGHALSLDGDAMCQLRARVKFAKTYEPSVQFPEFDRDWARGILSMILPNARSFEQLRQADLAAFAKGMLTPVQMKCLQNVAPERVRLQNGLETAVDYTLSPPVIRVKIQKAFGTYETPKVAAGKVPVIFHLLAPNGSVAQTTQDIASFWKNTYADVRKILRGRYPKHDWPQTPP